MFAGALVGTGANAPDGTHGFISGNVAFATPAYTGMDFATFHKFTYVDAYT